MTLEIFSVHINGCIHRLLTGHTVSSATGKVLGGILIGWRTREAKGGIVELSSRWRRARRQSAAA